MMIKSGDIFGIKTARGEAYFQYVKRDKLMGPLIRVLPGIYRDDVPDIEALAKVATNFWIFFPVGPALKSGIVRKVAQYKIPEHAQKMPLFRTGVPDPETRKVETWWLWDGETSWQVGAITDEQRKLPLREAWNDTRLVERIESGWLPEKDLR